MSPPPTPLTVVGIGADGWDGLPGRLAQALRDGRGAHRRPAPARACCPRSAPASASPGPSPLRPAVPGLLAAHAGRRVCVLASGDPMFYGIGRTLTEVLAGPGAPAGAARIPPPSPTPAPGSAGRWRTPRSSASSAAPSRPWPARCTTGRRLLVPQRRRRHPRRGRRAAARPRLRPDPDARAGTARRRAGTHGRGHRRRLGRTRPATPSTSSPSTAAARPAPRACPPSPACPTPRYEHDGQLTKRHVRAATLAALAPAPGELLWDVGGGSGSIAVEWMRAHRSCRAVSVERDPVRAERIARNAAALGVPALRVVTGAAPGRAGRAAHARRGVHRRRADRPRPAGRLLGRRCPPGGRLVANTVTLESEALLADLYRQLRRRAGPARGRPRRARWAASPAGGRRCRSPSGRP